MAMAAVVAIDTMTHSYSDQSLLTGVKMAFQILWYDYSTQNAERDQEV